MGDPLPLICHAAIAKLREMKDKTLLVFAHADEAEAFTDVPHLVTGIGKINAAVHLTEAILAAAKDIDRVIVMGTAGAIHDEAQFDTVYQIAQVLQHDFSLPSPTLELSGELVAPHSAVIATGDVFVQSDELRRALAELGASLVDMETYAYAVTCERLKVPLQVFKTPTDFADSSTTQDEWNGIVGTKSQQLRLFTEQHLPNLLG